MTNTLTARTLIVQRLELKWSLTFHRLLVLLESGVIFASNMITSIFEKNYKCLVKI